MSPFLPDIYPVSQKDIALLSKMLGGLAVCQQSRWLVG